MVGRKQEIGQVEVNNGGHPHIILRGPSKRKKVEVLHNLCYAPEVEVEINSCTGMFPPSN